MMTESITVPPFCYHQRADGRLRAKMESTPHVRPAPPTTRESEANTGTSSSQIHAVPHSETHKLARYANATNATGRVKRRSEEHTSELQSRLHLVCRLLLEKKKKKKKEKNNAKHKIYKDTHEQHDR